MAVLADAVRRGYLGEREGLRDRESPGHQALALAAGLAAAGVVCFAAGLVVAYVIADHSSSDSSPSSLTAIGLSSAGIVLLLLSVLLLSGHGLGLLWRYIRRPPRGG